MTQAFCEYLEYHLTETLKHSEDADYRRCWCDGVLIPDPMPLDQVKTSRKILTHAWIDEGKNRGQFKYELSIRLGDKSLAHYLNGLDLQDCLPAHDNADWILLDRNNLRIEIQLL
ncbi:MAG: hypothetical protein JNN28_11905 [Saprospiraceae bacterium]|nr:hypothetical protein [Saprospiraceae bacterium]